MASPALAIGLLHRLGSLTWLRVEWSDVAGWLTRTPLEDTVAATLRYIALGVGYWLLLSTLGYLTAMISGRRRWVDAAARITLPAIRKVAERVVASSLALSTMAAPLVGFGLDTPPSHPTASVAPDYLPFEVAPPMEASNTPHLSEIPLGIWDPEPEISIRLDASLEVVVRPGDHLWALAERRMTEVMGRPVADHEIAPYWVRVIEANRSSIRSGNPDLIYPGEVIVLPAVDG